MLTNALMQAKSLQKENAEVSSKNAQSFNVLAIAFTEYYFAIMVDDSVTLKLTVVFVDQ